VCVCVCVLGTINGNINDIAFKLPT